MNDNKNIVDVKPLDGNMQVTVEEAKRLLKEHNNKVSNGNVNSFVSLKDINKIYPNGVQAVYDFNIDIEENDFIVLVGPSGCGKSTTLRMVAGLEDITSGYLYIDKVLSNYLSSKDRDISMVFQSYALYPQMSVYENIAFPLRARKYRKIKRAEAVEGIDQVNKALDNIEQIKVAIVEANDVAKGAKAICSYISTKLSVNDYASKFIYENKEAISLGDVAPIVFDVALKPTPSISKAQETVDLEAKKNTTINIEGRHDPCVAPRAVPVVEAAAAIALYDLLLVSM